MNIDDLKKLTGGNLFGFNLVEHQGYETLVKRTWKERLFTRPWTPMTTHRAEKREIIEDGQVLIAYDTIYANAKTMKAIKDVCRNYESHWSKER